jgi:transcriptional regulator of NAD metabolism
VNFSKVNIDGDIKEIIKSLFDMDLEISGGWGYSRQEASIILDDKSMPIKQREHIIASMRSYIEMNVTQDKDTRYAGINLQESSREEMIKDDEVYHKITYAITAILESRYKELMKEYKEGYETDEFDMTKHFEDRKESTLTRVEEYWFKIKV